VEPIIDIENPEFRDLLSHVESITFIGGEPLLYSEHEQIMSYLIDSRRSAEVELHYYTNTTVLPDRILTAWKSFKKIDLRSSIDGVGDCYDYIRNPGKWSVVEKNIRKLNNSDLENLEHSICFVFMNINSLELEKLFRWRSTVEWKRKAPTIRPDYLVEPEFLRPSLLPPLEKQRALCSLLLAMELASGEEKKLILDMKEQMSEDHPDIGQHLTHLKFYLKAIDQRRKLDSSLLWPWLAENTDGEVSIGVASRS
jgi:hypothetical protein